MSAVYTSFAPHSSGPRTTVMSVVSYDGQAIIPGPFLSFNRTFQTADDGTVIGSTVEITAKGKIAFDRGSPNSSGVFWTAAGYPPDESLPNSDQMLGSILRKQAALQRLFSEQGKSFVVQPFDGTSPVTFNPRVKNISFPEGSWTVESEYTILMEADVVNGLYEPSDDGNRVSKANEEWNLEILDEKFNTYRLTRHLSATGKRSYDETGAVTEAWENAKSYVLDTMTLGLKPDRMTNTGVVNGGGLRAYNYLRSCGIGEKQGNYSATETWVCYEPTDDIAALDESTSEVRVTRNENRTRVTTNGTITGFSISDNTTQSLTSSRYTNALAKWDSVKNGFFDRAVAAASGFNPHAVLNPKVLTTSMGVNQNAGTINYSAEYDDRPTCLVANALSQQVSFTNHNQGDIFATQVVLGRPIGPVLQGIGTKTAKKRDVQIEIQMKPSSMAYVATIPDSTAILLDFIPAASKLFVDTDNEQFSPETGRYTRNTSFTYEV